MSEEEAIRQKLAGNKNCHKYDDIIGMEYPLKSHDEVRYPRMDIGDRAKIFSPFSALKGYEEAIEEKNKVPEEKDFY